MAVVSIKFFFSDLRQEVKVLDVNLFFKKWFPELEGVKYITNVWLHPQPIEAWYLGMTLHNCGIKTSSAAFDTTSIVATNLKEFYYWSAIFQKVVWGGTFFPMDLSCWYKNDKLYMCLVFSCFFKRNFLMYLFSLDSKTIDSLSKIFSSFVWVEREAKEFYNIFFVGLKDSRRLLTDYTADRLNTNSYETRGYNLTVQDIYYKGLLHWLFVFTYLAFCLTISLGFLNKGLLSLLLVSEVVLLLLFFIALIVSTLYNIYYTMVVSFFILIFGGLELTLNLLIMLI